MSEIHTSRGKVSFCENGTVNILVWLNDRPLMSGPDYFWSYDPQNWYNACYNLKIATTNIILAEMY